MGQEKRIQIKAIALIQIEGIQQLRGQNFAIFDPPLCVDSFWFFLTEEILLYHGGLQSRELGQAPMLLVFFLFP